MPGFEEETSFKLWSLTATTVQVVVYESASTMSGYPKDLWNETGNSYSYSHKDNTIGVWNLTVPESLVGRAYQYQINFPHHQSLTRDPYTNCYKSRWQTFSDSFRKERQVEGLKLRMERKQLGDWKILVKRLFTKCTFVTWPVWNFWVLLQN